MNAFADTVRAYRLATQEVFAETLWPTRCAVCERPGELLCAACRRDLAHIDWWRACPRCGAPFGRVQCSECNPVMLGRFERDRLPLDACASALVLDDAAARIVRTYKDQGERRLASVIADIMAPLAHPAWLAARPAIVSVPATRRAVSRRGFDHMEEVAAVLSRSLDLPCAFPLARPRSADQRGLSRRQRIGNMKGRFRALPGATAPEAVLLVDDVHTTGATLFEAADALRAAGAQRVFGLTFARAW